MAEYYWTTWKRSRNSLNRKRNRKRRDTPAPPGDSYARTNWTLMCRRIKMEKWELLLLRHFWYLMDILVVWRELRLDRSGSNLEFYLKISPCYLFFQSSPLWSRVTTGHQQDVENYLGLITEGIVSRDDLKMTETRSLISVSVRFFKLRRNFMQVIVFFTYISLQ